MASEMSTPVTTAVIIRSASNVPYVGARLLNKLKTMNSAVSVSISFRFGK